MRRRATLARAQTSPRVRAAFFAILPMWLCDTTNRSAPLCMLAGSGAVRDQHSRMARSRLQSTEHRSGPRRAHRIASAITAEFRWLQKWDTTRKSFLPRCKNGELGLVLSSRKPPEGPRMPNYPGLSLADATAPRHPAKLPAPYPGLVDPASADSRPIASPERCRVHWWARSFDQIF
jgi:hypothetical protein